MSISDLQSNDLSAIPHERVPAGWIRACTDRQCLDCHCKVVSKSQLQFDHVRSRCTQLPALLICRKYLSSVYSFSFAEKDIFRP